MNPELTTIITVLINAVFSFLATFASNAAYSKVREYRLKKAEETLDIVDARSAKNLEDIIKIESNVGFLEKRTDNIEKRIDKI